MYIYIILGGVFLLVITLMLFIRTIYDKYFISSFVGLLLLSIGIICMGALFVGWDGAVYIFFGTFILICIIPCTVIAVLLFYLIKYFKKNRIQKNCREMITSRKKEFL
ncbi:hypothetical protein CSV71_05535 [Sporosarcina sp. P21c]|nr:hypothetical protein CSV78_13565 [Sporosarcina sp. P16a]PIC90166.1 hypothetical protein CSV71_05535 [Sporosarcina sp. P21c]PIC91909.1 hypothetical protein CSV70_13495 [Sporosarcina sp. P25]